MTIHDVFQKPGTSLLENPFGVLPCFFMGVFYPVNPEEALISLQENVLRLMSQGGKALMFQGQDLSSTTEVEGDLAAVVDRAIEENDQLLDINLFFPESRGGVCISQEESLFFCASFDAAIVVKLSNQSMLHQHTIWGSVSSIKDYVRVLFDDEMRYFN